MLGKLRSAFKNDMMFYKNGSFDEWMSIFNKGTNDASKIAKEFYPVSVRNLTEEELGVYLTEGRTLPLRGNCHHDNAIEPPYQVVIFTALNGKNYFGCYSLKKKEG